MKTTTCILCTFRYLEPVLDMGDLPLPNRLPTPSTAGPDPLYPQTLVVCGRCGLLQLGHQVPAAEMFTHYTYVPSTSNVLQRHFRDLAATIIGRERLEPGHLVVDIGSNDGLLLRFFRELSGCRVQGIDPASNIAEAAALNGIPTRVAFFDESVGLEYKGAARVITATNCLAHTANLRSYLAGVREMLAPDGVFIAEFPYAWSMIEGLQVDTIYHEHQSYFGLTPLMKVMPELGLRVVDAERIPVHGGSLRVTVAHKLSKRNISQEAIRLWHEELDRKPTRSVSYRAFAHQVAEMREDIHDSLMRLGEQYRMVGFGASAKAAVLLNWARIGPETIEWVADANPLKQNCLIPGVRIPIRPEQNLETERVEMVVNFIWNLQADVKAKLAAYRAHVPVVTLQPRVEVDYTPAAAS